MRYCTNCGSPMGDERFCNQCGKDNGAAKTSVPENSTGASATSQVDMSAFLNYASSIFFAIAAIVLIAECCSGAKYMSVYSMLYTGTSLFALVYFALGMWSCIPALKFLLNIKKDNSASVIGGAVVMIVIMIALCLIGAVFMNSNGIFKYLSVVAGVYKSKVVTVIILELIAAFAAILAPRMTK